MLHRGGTYADTLFIGSPQRQMPDSGADVPTFLTTAALCKGRLRINHAMRGIVNPPTLSSHRSCCNIPQLSE